MSNAKLVLTLIMSTLLLPVYLLAFVLAEGFKR